MAEIIAIAKNYGSEPLFFVLGIASMVIVLKIVMGAQQKSHEKAIDAIKSAYETSNTNLKNALEIAMKENRKKK